MPDQKNQTTTQKPSNGKDFVPLPPQPKTGDMAGQVSGLLDQAKSAASEAYDTVTETATSKLEGQKAGLKSSLTSVADSIRKAGDSIGETPEQNYLTEYTAQYAKTAAQKLESVANYFESSDMRKMARDAENFARRNPAVFLGSAFALGVLAARFFKSSPSPKVGHGAVAHEQEPLEKARTAESGTAQF